MLRPAERGVASLCPSHPERRQLTKDDIPGATTGAPTRAPQRRHRIHGVGVPNPLAPKMSRKNARPRMGVGCEDVGCHREFSPRTRAAAMRSVPFAHSSALPPRPPAATATTAEHRSNTRGRFPRRGRAVDHHGRVAGHDTTSRMRSSAAWMCPTRPGRARKVRQAGAAGDYKKAIALLDRA